MYVLLSPDADRKYLTLTLNLGLSPDVTTFGRRRSETGGGVCVIGDLDAFLSRGMVKTFIERAGDRRFKQGRIRSEEGLGDSGRGLHRPVCTV